MALIVCADLQFFSHHLFQTVNVWIHSLNPLFPQSQNTSQIVFDLFLEIRAYRNDSSTTHMNMVNVALCYREHILQQKGCFTTRIYSYYNRKATTIFFHLFITNRPIFFHSTTKRNHPHDRRIRIFVAIKRRSKSPVFFILHKFFVLNFIKICILYVIKQSFLSCHRTPPPIKRALPCDRA